MTLADFIAEWHDPCPDILVHTSGSTGKPKAMLVQKARMMASARMTCDFLALNPGDTALLCMSLDYIAGKMMVVRSIERGLKLIEVEPSGHPLKDITLQQAMDIDFAAMVPMQVYNTLKVAEEREKFCHISNVIIGGGAIDPTLEAELKTLPNNIYSSYGMTETLSHIALRSLTGNDGETGYRPLPGISVSRDDRGCLVIDAPQLNPQILHTNDIVEFVQDGGFIIRGRLDNVICSGGIKIQIEDVEAALRPAFGDTIMVTSVPSIKFGEVVAYLCTQPLDEHLMRLAVLNNYWLPKHIIPVSQLPRTETGKPDRARAKDIAMQWKMGKERNSG